MSKEIIPIERVVQSIRWIRGQKVLLDSDLAAPDTSLCLHRARHRHAF
jgi:hypothetical protein